jgi:superfamily II DNA or RNA helicase
LHDAFSDYSRQIFGQRPHDAYVQIFEKPTSGPLDPFLLLSAAGSARYTEVLLPFAVKDTPWEVRHKTRPQYGTYQSKKALSLEEILIKGRFETSCGVVPVSESVGAELEHWSELLPVAKTLSASAPGLNLPSELDALSGNQWKAAFERALSSSSIDAVADFYFEAAIRGIGAPKHVLCQIGSQLADRPPHLVFVSDDELTIESLGFRGEASLAVRNREAAEVLVQKWGFQLAAISDAAKFNFVATGPGVAATDRFPELGVSGREVELVPCSDLWVEITTDRGLNRESKDLFHKGQTLYYRDGYADADLLREIRRLFGLDITPIDPEATSRHVTEFVQGLGSIEEKLAALLGENRLRRRLPIEILEQIEAAEQFGGIELARIAHAVYGTAVLAEFADDLRSVGLDPPSRWNGNDRAIDFVTRLGIPREYAGASAEALTPYIEVPGPITLPPLHPFQTKVESNLRVFLREDEPGRGFVSLPTGAGKTRVVAEALVGGFRDKEVEGTVLWIADREELCEQAVQTWSDVWRALGPNENLRISRLWGSTNNKVRPVSARPHLVVATYQTLKRRLTSDFEWLSKPACIVVDEAHGSTAPSFTQILEWLGLDFRHTSRPLIGLSATPFRGSAADAEETKRLVSRYGNRRFDYGVFTDGDPYPFLQQIGVLARVDQQLLPGVELHLTPEELEHLGTFGEMPPSAEEKLGHIQTRNASIVEAVANLPSSWPVLIFALSVAHAELLASLLSLRGISAVAISSTRTRIDARRNAIRAFKKGQLRVLTNYGVLTTGFDAPGVRALFVTRPVFSPGLYQQMIGRGLRGPANGGKERCLIVNVEDNFAQFGEKLAFRHFEYLWSKDPSYVS